MLASKHLRKKWLLRAAGSSVITALLVVALGYCPVEAANPAQETFASPQEAVKAMVTAMKSADIHRLQAIFGPSSKALFLSGNPDVDRQMRENFVRAYEEKNRLEAVGKNKMVLHVGQDDWAWPIPVVGTNKKWSFSTEAGKKEILARKIGENEIAVVQFCLAYVDAQLEYALEYAQDRKDGGVTEYAQKFISGPGKTDGLCWDEKEGKKRSPFGPILCNTWRASHGGSTQNESPQPYHGYFYKILKKQGDQANGGAYDYVVDGRMIGGFALVAYPAKYFSTGVMTFVVNQDGVIYEKNLGKNTKKLAEAITSFNPDRSWTKVE